VLFPVPSHWTARRNKQRDGERKNKDQIEVRDK
jgi:hypothetical protein